MCLVHIQAIYTQLLKGNDIILTNGVLKLFELRFQSTLGTLQRLDGKTLCSLILQTGQP